MAGGRNVSDAEIGRRLGVAHTTIGRGRASGQAARQQAPAPLQAEPRSPVLAAPGADAERDAAQAGAGAGAGRVPEPAGEPQACRGRRGR